MLQNYIIFYSLNSLSLSLNFAWSKENQ